MDLETFWHNRNIVLMEEGLTVSDRDINEMPWYKWHSLLESLNTKWKEQEERLKNKGKPPKTSMGVKTELEKQLEMDISFRQNIFNFDI